MSGGADTKAAVAPAPTATYLEPHVHGMLANPVRHEIIMKTGERAWTASELAEATGEPLKLISKGLRALEKAGLVEIVETGPGPKGGIVRRYRAVDRFMLDAEEWESLSMTEQANSTVNIIRVLYGEISKALHAGTFYRHPHHVLIRRPMWVDDEGMRELDEVYCRADAEAAEVERRCAERRGDQPPVRVITGIQSFPAAPESNGLTE